jgi:hypothetical protein
LKVTRRCSFLVAAAAPPHGQTRLRSFAIGALQPGQPLQIEFHFIPVDFSDPAIEYGTIPTQLHP